MYTNLCNYQVLSIFLMVLKDKCIITQKYSQIIFNHRLVNYVWIYEHKYIYDWKKFGSEKDYKT